MSPCGRDLALFAALAGVAVALSCRTPHGVAAPSAPPAAATAGDAPLAEASAPVAASRLLQGSIPLLATDMTEADLSEVVSLPALILYFSTSCPHCWIVAPEFQESCGRLQAHGIQCLGIVSSSSRLGSMRDFAEQTGLDCPLYLDYAGEFRDSYVMTSTPTGVFFDENGHIAFQAQPYYRGAALTVEMALAEEQGRVPSSVWREGAYAGPRSCASCHDEAYNSWLLSSHAVTMVRMPGETHLDPACIACHTTAAGEPGGFVNLTDTSHLRDVGCEACHTASGGHRPDGTVTAVDPRTRCASCHDPDHTMDLDLDTMVAVLDHEVAATVPRARWEMRRLKLAEGRHERVGLAMPQGKCAGSTRCAECHPDQAEAWTNGPHGHAMATLEEAGSQRDKTCLACHAPTDPCAQPKKGAWAGIGCETCHGAGAEHSVDGTGPVTGLRPSHAEYCVVEPTCRRCHTEARDPGWELGTRMQGIH